MTLTTHLMSGIGGAATSAALAYFILGSPSESPPAPESAQLTGTFVVPAALPSNSVCDQTDQQLIAWRDAQIQLLFKPTWPRDTPQVLFRDDVNAAAKVAFEALDQCVGAQPGRFAPGTPMERALGNFLRFVRALHWMAIKEGPPEKPTFPHQLGFHITDRTYYEQVKARVDIPELLASKEFMTAMASPDTYKRALELIDKHNESLPENDRWIPVLMKTQFITTVDFGHGIPSNPKAPRATYGRLLVFLPQYKATDGVVADLWVLFGIVTPEMPQDTPMHNVSVFASVPDSPNRRGRTTTYSMDNWRDVRNDGSVRVTPTVFLPQEPGDPAKDPSKNCYDCHKMPVLPFYPDTLYKLDDTGKLVPEDTAIGNRILRKLNDRIKGYGPPDFGFMDVGAYGPPLGPAVERSDEYLQKCSGDAELSQEGLSRLRDAMMCGKCHNENLYGSLNYPISTRSKRDFDFLYKVNMIETFIEKGYMPPKSKLSAPERHALFQCLQNEYLDLNTGTGLLVDWLKGTADTTFL